MFTGRSFMFLVIVTERPILFLFFNQLPGRPLR
jgi:hypothetical protein